MALTYVADLPIPLLCPSLYAALGLPAMSLNASLTGALALNASIAITPPTMALYLQATVDWQAQMTLGIGLGAPPVSFKLSDTLSLSASLQLSFSLLLAFEAELNLSLSLGFGAGLYAFTYEGAGNALGSAVTTELSAGWPDGSTGSCTGIVLGAATPIAATQIAALLDGVSFSAGLTVGNKLGSLAALSKLTAKASVQGSAAISAQLAATAALTAKASISVAPPTLAVQFAAVAKFYANLVADLSLAPPAIKAAVSANAKLAASISAQFSFMAQLGACLSRYDAELFAYSYTGTPSGFGSALTTSLATTWGDGTTPTSGACACVVLAALDPVSAGAMGFFFGGV